GTRTGASGGPRAPLENILDIGAAADDDFVEARTQPGDIPAGVTHIRIAIEAINTSASERFVFDNLAILGTSGGNGGNPVDPDPAPSRPEITGISHLGQTGTTVRWFTEEATSYRVEYHPDLETANGWQILARRTGEGSETSFFHAGSAGRKKGFYRIVRE
ncbi:MAG: hypothetical protein AAF514_07500, partial [Verrucomicrobiota bacterium]